jgi:hypothetical protein
MSRLSFLRYILQCDGCKTRHGDPIGHNSAEEARIAAYVDGWRFPALLKSDGAPGTRASDVCPECMPTWTPRRWQDGDRCRQLAATEAPTATP